MAVGFLRRHLSGFELCEDDLPSAVVFRDGLAGRIRPQIELSFLFLSVTFEAVSLKEWMHRFGEAAFKVALADARPSTRPCHEKEKGTEREVQSGQMSLWHQSNSN